MSSVFTTPRQFYMDYRPPESKLGRWLKEIYPTSRFDAFI
jgi:hypothetical protein